MTRFLPKFALATVLFSASAAHAQNYMNSQQFGNMRFDNGVVNGQSFNSTTQRMGNMEFQNGSIGGRTFSCTTQHIGSQTFTNCH